MIALWLIMIPHLVPDGARPQVSAPHRRAIFSIGPRRLWPLAAIAFCCGLVEEAFADWGALYLSQDLRTNPGTAALGYTIFSCAMLVGRLRGDKLVRNIGPAPVVRLGVALGMSGIMAGMVINTAWAFLLSFGLVGLGFSTVIPIVYRTAGSMPGIDGAAGVAGVATACYSAFLIGPPLMGFVSDQLSLRAAFVMVGIVTSIAIVLAPAVHNQSPAPLGVPNGLETISDPASAVAL